MDLGLRFEPCTREDFFKNALKLQTKYGLLTNDSVLLATAIRLQADVMATADTALQKVSELNIARPSDWPGRT